MVTSIGNDLLTSNRERNKNKSKTNHEKQNKHETLCGGTCGPMGRCRDYDDGSTKKSGPTAGDEWRASQREMPRPTSKLFPCLFLFVCVFWGGLGPPKTFPLLFLLFSSCCAFFCWGSLSIYSTTNYVRIPSMESALIVWNAIFPYFIIIPLQGRKLVAKFIPDLKIILAL